MTSQRSEYIECTVPRYYLHNQTFTALLPLQRERCSLIHTYSEGSLNDSSIVCASYTVNQCRVSPTCPKHHASLGWWESLLNPDGQLPVQVRSEPSSAGAGAGWERLNKVREGGTGGASGLGEGRIGESPTKELCWQF